MWSAVRRLSGFGEHPSGAALELLESTFRDLILLTGAIYLAWHTVSTTIWADEQRPRIWAISLIVMPTCLLAYRLASKRFVIAQVVWQVGLAAAITLAVIIFREPSIGLVYTLLPLVAAVSVGSRAGLLAEILIAVLAFCLAGSGAPWAIPATYAWAIVLGGAFTGLLGWAATRSLLTVTEWSLFSYERAQRHVEEARDQRLELKRIQADLLLANRELDRLSDRLSAMYRVSEEARRVKEEFVANVSHELRTPLNMIIGFSEMIPRLSRVYATRLPSALLRDIAAIHRNGQHLAKLVDDVLDLSQVEAGRLALSKEWVALPEIVEQAAQVVQALFESKGLYLEVEPLPELEPVYCDRTRIRQVLINLLSNAGRFTESGGVRVRVERRRDDLVLSVADTGPGIPEQERERIFEPFQQLESSIRRQHGGSGLGLSISKRFVEMHGGRMWLESELAAGTTFYFSLPLDGPAPSVVPSSDARRWLNPYHEYAHREGRSKVPVASPRPRFVLLDQEDGLLRLFARYMDDAELVAVRDVATARRELGRSPAQALIVNGAAQEAPGPTSQLADLAYGAPTITCWLPSEGEAARRLGVLRYLVKPFSSDELLAALADLDGIETILVVEDEPEAAHLLARMLSAAERRYRILQATNGQRALSLLRERRPDLVLLDLVMPGLDGYALLQQKAQDPSLRDIPTIVISARDPSGGPLVSQSLTVTCSGGLAVGKLLECIWAVSEVLAPLPEPYRGPRGKPPE